MTDNTNSTVVRALEKAWGEIRVAHPDVPTVVMIVASGSSGRTLKWGHYAEGRWTSNKKNDKAPEVLISGEGFQRGATDVMGTLLHEAAHGMAATRKLQDTSRDGRYHNKVFKQLAEELGLTVGKQGTRGLAATSMPPETIKKWRRVITDLSTVIKSYRFAEGPRGGSKSENRQLLAICQCRRKIRLSRETYDAGPIICRVCERHFELRE